jgi:hypothetical protein
MLWGIKIWQIVVAVIAFPVLVISGIVIFQIKGDSNFQPKNDQSKQKISSKLSAARDLTGTWTGTLHENLSTSKTPDYCVITGNLTLNLDQSGNSLNGSWSEHPVSQQAADGYQCSTGQDFNTGIQNGSVSSSSFNFSLGGGTQIEGSFTTDLINGNGSFSQGATTAKLNFRLSRSH